MTTYGAFRALIAGGSVAGLAAAFELRNIGAEALVFERSAGQMQTRGAGVVMQPEVEDLLNKMGRSARSVSVELVERQQLHHRKLPTRFHAPQLMTAWDTLYRALRATLPDECYSLGSRLTGFRRDDSGVTADFADGGTAHGDLLIGADGVGSATRRLIDPALQAHYSGYVAWRGLEDEAALPRDLVELLAGRFTFFGSSGLQMLSYLVPGPNGELDAGKRRVNWVWYMNIPSQSLPRRLTSKSGKQYKTFLPSQELAADTTPT